MRSMTELFFSALLLGPACFGQNWEVGGAGSYEFYRNISTPAPAGTAKLGFTSGAALSVVGTQNIRHHLGGEVRYTYGLEDLKVAGARTAKMEGQSHAFQYDFLVYGTRRGSTVRPFLAAGAGAKLFRGTGPETAFRPMDGVAVLTHAQEIKPLVSIGGGVKLAAGRHAILRLDFRDNASPFPNKVITPVPPAGRITGWLHDFLILAGAGLAF